MTYKIYHLSELWQENRANYEILDASDVVTS